MSLLSRIWRVFATAFCFLSFGMGGALILLIVSPLLILLIRNKERRQHLGKRIVSLTFYWFILLMRAVGVLTFEVKNAELLKQPGQLVLANHPSLIDTIFLIAFCRDADCVVKAKLLNNPFTWGPITMTGYITNNDEPEQVIAAAKASLKAGNNLIIFPEGTRSTQGQPLKMKRGAANIAIKSGAIVRPVIIRCAPPVLTKELKWYQVPQKRVHISFEVRPVLPLDQYNACPGQALAARQLTQDLEDFFNRAASTAIESGANELPAPPPQAAQ